MKFLILLLLYFELNTYSQTFFRQEISQSDFRDVTFLQAIQNLQRKSQDIDKQKLGFNYVFTAKAAKFADKKLTLSLTQLPLSEAIKYTALSAKLELKFERNTLIILAPGEKFKEAVIKEQFVRYDERLLNSLRLECKSVSSNMLDLKDVLQLIRDESVKSDKNGKSINILDISGSTAKTLISLKNTSVYEALRYTAIAAGTAMKLDRSAIVFQKK